MQPFYVPVNGLYQDFIFQDDDENLYILSRNFLDRLAKDFSLRFFNARTYIFNESADKLQSSPAKVSKKGKRMINEIYKDSNNFVIFKYNFCFVEVPCGNHLLKLKCLKLSPKVEIHEADKDVKSYELDIRTLLNAYIDNDNFFKTVEKILNDFVQKQSYII
jgi:hypothetical protein